MRQGLFHLPSRWSRRYFYLAKHRLTSRTPRLPPPSLPPSLSRSLSPVSHTHFDALSFSLTLSPTLSTSQPAIDFVEIPSSTQRSEPCDITEHVHLGAVGIFALSSKFGTQTIVTAKFSPWLSSERPKSFPLRSEAMTYLGASEKWELNSHGARPVH